MRPCLSLAATLLTLPLAGGEPEPGAAVDPFIGTGGHGHTFPGATMPFGMVQLGPDTRLQGWDGCSGYHDSDRVVYGFSHTHLSGTGIADYGDILFMPVTGEPQLTGYASRFDKASERAEPGFYGVLLDDYKIAVELTVTERAGLHRYVLPAGRPAHVIVDLTHRDRVVESELELVGDCEIEGFRRSTGWARDQVVYFVARFSRPFGAARLALDDLPRPGARTAVGTSVKGVLSFGDGGGEVLVKVGISAVDVAGARRNLDAELPGWDFDAVRREAGRTWNEALRRFEVEGGSPAERTIFYTALYHSMIAPNVFSDVDGRYRGMDRGVHRAEGRRQYTVFSLWDTFRATHPLLTLIEPERTREFIETFLAHYAEGGRLPVWELAGNETDTMIGYHAVPVIVDAWVKGIRGFDAERALSAMVDGAMRDHFGLSAYRRQGFIGAEDDAESVSKTLEYAYDDACIAHLAAHLGREDLAAEFARRSQGWRHLFDPTTGFLRARRNQSWVEPFDPRRVDNHYTEANAWQYSFFVPHDIGGLIEMHGGDARFVARLDALFDADSATTGREQADITGMIGQYAHGNEPSHHMAWLYHYAGRPELGAARVRRILDELYSTAPGGLSGNDDCGQLSSWYVFAASGLYPVAPGSDQYVIGVPRFGRVTLHLGGNKAFTIRAESASRGASFIESARLDGKALTRSYLRHEEIVRGGKLELKLAARPGAAWGKDPGDRPHARAAGERVLAAPLVRAASDRFRDRMQVELYSVDPGTTIRFRRDPAGAWEDYERPIELDATTRLSLVAERDSLSSPVVEAYFHELPHDWSIDVESVPNPQYTAGGPEALIDGLRGTENWRTGGWQGYQHTDFVATVDRKAAGPIRSVGASFLQDVRSWIWMPRELIVSVSNDGSEFREIARVSNDVPDDDERVTRHDLVASLDGVAGRYVRIVARNYGAIPDWHPGHGDFAFIFVDEILID